MAKNKDKGKDKKADKGKDKSADKGKSTVSAKDRVVLEDCRGLWLYIKEPRPLNDEDKNDEDKDPQYEMTVLLDEKKQKKSIAKVEALVMAVAKDNGLKPKDDWLSPIKSGDAEYKKRKKKGKDAEKALQGMVVLKLKTYYKPDVVNQSNETAMPEDWQEMGFSGCYFNVSLTAKHYDYKGNEGVRLQLGNVMFRREGKRIGGGVSAQSEFSKYADD